VIVLRFQHDSTTSEWRFEGIDEPALRRMLQDLNLYAVDGDAAVLTAEDANGTKIGAWSRAGAAHLASVMFRERTTPPWSDVEAAVQQAVMDPHPDEAAPA
jgi:hypothetical protein